MRLIVVTGTGTGIGKTVTAAALVACGLLAGQRVAAVKPIQTGVLAGQPADLAGLAELTGLADLHEYARYAEPLAPATAARRVGEPGPAIDLLAGRIAELADRDLVVIEGAGGALVRFNERGEGILELTATLRQAGWPVQVVLVCSAALGCLHDAAVTARALAQAGAGPDWLVVGDWPAEPGLAERCNLTDLTDYADCPLAGVLPHGSGRLAPAGFAELARRSLTRALGGSFDAPEFIASHAAPTAITR